MGVIIPIVIFYAVFVIMELPLLRSGGRGRLLFCVLLLLNLVVSVAAARGLRLPSPTPLFETVVQALPFRLQVTP